MLLSLVAVSVVLALLTVFALELSNTQAKSRQDVTARVHERAVLAAALIDSLFEAVGQQAPADARKYGAAVVSDRTMESNRRENTYVVLLDSSERVLAQSRGFTSQAQTNLAGSAALALVRSGRPYGIGNVLPYGGKGVINLAVALPTRSGKRILVTGFAPSMLGTFIGGELRKIPGVKGARNYLIDGRRTVIASTDPARRAGQVFDEPAAITALARPSGAVNGHYYDQVGISNSTWRLVLAAPEGPLFASVSGLRKWVPWAIFIAFATVAAAAFLLGRRALDAADQVRRSNAQLVRQREQLVAAQSVAEFGSWEWDIATDATEWSVELYRIYGLEPSDDPMTFEDLLACVHDDDRAAVQAQVQSSYASGEPFSFEHRIVRPDGVMRVCQARGEVIRGDDGAPVRMLGTSQDITERREVERAKDEFTSMVSHELRTPLTSIRGSLGLLESGLLGVLPEKGQRMVAIAVQNTDRLVRLINDILDIERIDAGTIHMHQQPCDARELLERAAQSMAGFAAQAQVSLIIEGDPVALHADPDRVLQTLTNLVSNAIKFSAAHSTVSLSCQGGESEVLFAVSDRGRGIPPDKLESIFERFQQVDASDSREKGGTGLGLAICRTIVEHHNGRIWATSRLGHGSTFSFVLPAPHIDATAPPDHPHAGPAILVCEDDPSVVEVITAMLTQRGYRVIAAHSGQQAIHHAITHHPDAILLDLLMPGMSGWQTATTLKEHPQTTTIPIVILSVLSQDEADAPEPPVDGWLEKPLDEAALFSALEGAIGAQGVERPR